MDGRKEGLKEGRTEAEGSGPAKLPDGWEMVRALLDRTFADCPTHRLILVCV